MRWNECGRNRGVIPVPIIIALAVGVLFGAGTVVVLDNKVTDTIILIAVAGFVLLGLVLGVVFLPQELGWWKKVKDARDKLKK